MLVFCPHACVCVRMPDLGVNTCELPCRCWELNLSPLEEQSVLLTTEPSPQPFNLITLKGNLMKKLCGNFKTGIVALKRPRQEDLRFEFRLHSQTLSQKTEKGLER